jgi:uncharacterized damage-inducible protein DinB
MNNPSMSGEELLAWNDTMATMWRSLVSSHPELLDTPCDIYKAKTAGELLQHIVAVELRFAERLIQVPETDYGSIPYANAEEIFATHARALDIFKGLLADSSFDWSEEMEFGTLSLGRLCAPRKALFQHALLHSVRHYAQLATLARQHGYKPGHMDYLLMAAKRVESPSAQS